MLNEDFLITLEHCIGIGRLCPATAGLLGQESIRDVILFPQLKQK